MKFVITGKHSSGKFEILDRLTQLHVRCGHVFSNASGDIYIDPLYKRYTREDIEIIYESQAYITYNPVDQIGLDSLSYVSGIDLQTWDSHDVFVLSPHEIPSINWSNIKDEVVFIWIDNDLHTRYKRFKDLGKYDFNHQERLESQYDDEFTDILYKHPVLYFNNDKIEHIIGVIYTLTKNPYMLDVYKTLYN